MNYKLVSLPDRKSTPLQSQLMGKSWGYLIANMSNQTNLQVFFGKHFCVEDANNENIVPSSSIIHNMTYISVKKISPFRGAMRKCTTTIWLTCKCV